MTWPGIGPIIASVTVAAIETGQWPPTQAVCPGGVGVLIRKLAASLPVPRVGSKTNSLITMSVFGPTESVD